MTRIGFIGGCIHRQAGMARASLYHARLQVYLRETQPEENYDFSFGGYAAYAGLVTAVEQFILKKKLHTLYCFVRPFPLVTLQTPIVQYTAPNGRQKRVLHPALLRRKSGWSDALTQHMSERPEAATPVRKSPLRNLNLLLGICIGLHHWARAYVARQLRQSAVLCAQHGVKMKVLLPPRNPESAPANAACRWMSDFLENDCRKAGIPCLPIYSIGEACFEADGIHFNSQGHQALFEILKNDFLR